MEIAGADGTKIRIHPDQTRELGRGNGIHSFDKTISRRQISFSLPQFPHAPLQFEVLGRNPIYVSRNDEVKAFRRFERGEMESGDMFCVSAKDPVWYSLKGFATCAETVRRNDELKSELSGDFEGDFVVKGADDLDISCIDPVTEFGFLVIGHELDLYPKKMIRDIKNWDWSLDGVGRESDDNDSNDVGKKGKRKGGKKRKKGAENEDEDWSGESEDDKVAINKPMNSLRPTKYTTRSKDRTKPGKSTLGSSSGKQTCDLDDEDEDDETLGGFIVDDENLDEDEDTHDEEEEEEFVDGEDE